MTLDPAGRSEIRRAVLRLAWPVVLQYLSRTVMFLVDQLFLGRVGAEALASMSVIGPIVHTLIAVLSAFGVGTVALVARATGERDPGKQAVASATSLAVSVGTGLLCLAAGLVLLPAAADLFRVRGAPGVTENVNGFLFFVALALPFMMLEVSGSSILRAAGDTKMPMVFGILANVLNIAGNWAFIFGNWGAPRMGVRGAGLATALAFGVQGLLTAGWLFTRRSPVPLGLATFRRVTADSMMRLLRLTVPATMEPVVMQAGFLVTVKVLVVLGAVPLAAHRAAIAVESISFMPGFAFSVACSALVGQYLGEGRPDKAEAGKGESLRFAVYLMSALGIVFLAVPQALIGFFIPGDPLVILAGAMCIAVAAFEQPLMAAAMVLGGALRGAGDTRSPVWVGVLGVWCVRVPLTWLLAIHLGMGIVGAWITMIADWAVRTAAFWVVWGRGRWKAIKL